MCGIAGIWLQAATAGPPETAAVRQMCQRMRHRGPDDLNVATGPRAALGIARLAIVDVATGRQPFVSADGRLSVVVNGEIYNAVELRAQLTRRGHRFATGSDGEVVLHLYEDLGLDCLPRLNGMFAIAIADEATGQLHLVRDRVGIKPLYWAADRHRLAFASDLRALAPLAPSALDREALAELLTLTYLPAPRTPLAGVSKLEAGTVLTWQDGRVRQRRWWRWPAPVGADAADPRELAERVRELTVDAVRLQLRADVPLGILLSGGVDSTALLWAARELGAAVPGFCVDFGEPDGDGTFARVAARELGARLETLAVPAGLAVDELPAAVATLPEPLGDPAVLPSLLICRAAAAHTTVLLSGTGADELWGGYGRYVLSGADARAVYVGELSVLPEIGVRQALGLAAGTPVAGRLSGLLARGAGGRDVAAARMYLDGVLSLPGDLLPLLDATSMAVSMEARVPLLDHRLVELAAGLAGPTRLPGGALKGLFRQALSGCVPDRVLNRPKRGFNPPLPLWTAGPLGGAARRALFAPDGLVGDVLDPAPVRRWLRPGTAPDGLLALRLWLLLVTDLWWRRLSGHSLDGLLAQVA